MVGTTAHSYEVKCRVLAAAFVLASISSAASAHPHAWIEVRTTVVLSARCTVSAIREEWTFDKLYTSTLLTDAHGTRKSLREFVQSAMRHLEPYHYFLALHMRDAELPIGAVINADGELSHDSLILRFTAPMPAPLDISGSGMTLAVYDPTYYIDFEHIKDHPLSFEGPEAQGCRVRIKQATPSLQALSQAAAMDRNAPANPTLGRLFAETVSIYCS